MDAEMISLTARAFAAEEGLTIWESFPVGGATALWPSEDLEAFLNLGQMLGSEVLYLDERRGIVGWARGGVVHAFLLADLKEAFESDIDGLFPDGNDDEEFGSYSSIGLGNVLTVGDDYTNPYFNFKTYKLVEGPLREIVDQVVADQRYDPSSRSGRHVASEYAGDISDDDIAVVENVAERVFRETVGKQLEKEARKLVPLIAASEGFDALDLWDDDDLVDSWIVGRDPRLKRQVEGDLRSYAHENGLTSKAEKDLERLAKQILDSLPALVRDQLGFAGRVATRESLLAPYVENVPEKRKNRVKREIHRLESSHYGVKREARYATATRKLLADGNHKPEVSRRLGISTNVMDRLMRTVRKDVPIEPDDPIVTKLVPGFDFGVD